MKKEEIYVNNINKEFENNQDYCMVKENSDNTSVNEKIDTIFNTNGYVFNKDVEIITDEKKYCTKIAGKVNNHIITMDNDIIDIMNIKDIIF